ncbi:hypothetical protein FNV43_RR20156 [Rhamnella rubrinervis]|uniref:At1g61320/AtMIF1 LRR domain-containing protein n=1 Tax=Rhamnella rubrinervis TaxID=2594499 RepID=A0A8K0DZU6_9ROSA|nr:hypothetical protein FNV43_RR20156 [Rhamnella rubrinervis]
MKDTSAYYCFLAPPSAIRLYWLKDLYLRGVNVVDKAIECLFSNSPFIGRFCLHYSQKLRKLEIADAPNLKYFELIFCDHLEHFQISAPNVNAIMLSVRGCPVHFNLYAPCLCHAALCTVHSFMNVCGYNMCLKWLNQVAITIGETLDFSHQLPELSTVEHLQIEFITLCLMMHIRDTICSRQMELQCFDKDGAEKVKALANAKWQYYSHQHLKEVELIDFIGSRNELEIVLFVLKIAALIEKTSMELNWRFDHCSLLQFRYYSKGFRVEHTKSLSNTANSEGPNDLNLVNIDSAEEETMSPVDLRRMKSTDILSSFYYFMQTARLGIMLIISLSELMSDVQETQMKSDGTLEESGKAQRYRNFLEEMTDESEHKSANPLREGGLLDSALSAIPEKITENRVHVPAPVRPFKVDVAIVHFCRHGRIVVTLIKCIAQSAVDVAGVVMQALLARNDGVCSKDHITSLRKICPMVSSEITFEAPAAEVVGYGAPKLAVAVDHTVIYLQLAKSISRKLSSFTFVHAFWKQLSTPIQFTNTTYYRVGFYGDRFEKLDRKEYVTESLVMCSCMT